MRTQHEVAAAARHRAGADSAAVRYRFIARASPEDPSPPMARLLRGGGGRGGAARLQLYLAMLWLCRNDGEPVLAVPSQGWAELLGWEDKAGTRRVQEALRWLDREAFVRLDRRRGDVSRVHLLDDAGSGTPYMPPGVMMGRLKKATPLEREPHLYAQLDARYWTNGWVTRLSGAAIAMYLAVLREQRGRVGETVWIAPSVGRGQYDLSDDTRNKGTRELVKHRLLQPQRRPVQQGAFDDRLRARTVYSVPSAAFRHHGSAVSRSEPEPISWAAAEEEEILWGDDL